MMTDSLHIMKNKLFILLSLATMGVFSSCTYEVDDVFDKSSAERIQETIQKDFEVLTSAPNGWLVSYYADLTYGGYNLIWKFNEDHTVTCANEIFQPTDTVATSHFKLEQSQGVVLSFDEHNDLIHIFADPSAPLGAGEEGDGMLGDFEFRILSACADSVVMLGKKHGSRIVMTPMKTADWTGYIEEVNRTELNMYPETGRFLLHVGEDSVKLQNQYRTLVFPAQGDGADEYVPYIITPEGIVFYEPYEYMGRTITGFAYSDPDSWPNPADRTVWLETAAPALADRIYSENWYFAEAGYSDPVWSYFSYAKKGVMAEGEQLEWMYLGHQDNKYGLFFKSDVYECYIGFSPIVIDDGHIFLQFNRDADDYGAYYYNYCGFNKVVTVIGTSTGWTYTLSADNIKNPTWIKLTNKNQPEFNFTLYKEPKYYPLGK